MPLLATQDKLLYWKEKLKDVSFLELYGDDSISAAPHAHESVTNFSFDTELLNDLRKLTEKQRTTIFTGLLAAFKVLLYKFSGQEDICVGTPVANPTHWAVEGLPASYRNMLLLRSNVNSQLLFTDFLRQVRATTIEAYQYRDVPFEKIMEAVANKKTYVRSPLKQVMMVLRHGSPVNGFTNGTDIPVQASTQETTKFDISFFITEDSNGLHCRMKYDTDLMSEAKINSMIHDFRNLLSSIVKEPHQRIVELITPAPAKETMGRICDSQNYDTYREEDHKTWAILTQRQKKLQSGKISKEYLDGFEQLKLDETRIVKIEELSERLKSLNGWTLIPVTGLIPTRDFFFMILNKQYPITVSIRKPWEIDFSEQPDIFHDVYGHLPLLTNQKFIKFLTAYSIIAFKYVHNQKAIDFLGRLYWFTYEMGLIKEEGENKPYGGAIITSAGEIENISDKKIPKYPFEVNTVFQTPYNPFKLQNEYFIINSFDDLFSSLENIELNLIESLSRLTPAEEHQLQFEFNNTAVEYPKQKTVVNLFEKQASKTPGAIAVIFDGQQLTYKELNEQSNQLANYLQHRGIGKNIPVPICVGRSIEMIVGLLGIMKAGGAYVPIDPDLPNERIAYMIESTEAKIILSNVVYQSKLPLAEKEAVICIDRDWKLIDKSSKEIPSNLPGPTDLAYVIFTSGTTGKPKGVMIEHSGLLNVSLYHIEEFSMTANDRYLQFMSPSFDGSILDIFTSLLSGGALVLPTKDVLSSSEKFIEFVSRHEVTVFTITPSFLSLLDKHDLPGVRTIISAGEAAIVEDALHYGSFKNFYNGYGPSEITVNATLFKVTHSDESVRSIPIGKPMANKNIYILNNDMQLCPIGVEGEIFISGVGVARGYLNNPELTAEKFIIDHFSTEPGTRMYRTGDIGRWLPDGNIEFLGRKDDQVKVNGYRIELAEIENVIHQCELVRQAVVLAKDDGSGNKRLVAYVVPEGIFEREPIVSYLRGWLPEYMIPASWIGLESFPLTHNGKINKKALPEFVISEHLSNLYVAPRNETENVLVKIWQEILQVPQVGVNDSFFELGGNSLRATRLISSIRKEFAVEMIISDIFANPRISSLSTQIAANAGVSTIPVIEIQTRPQELSLSFSQERLWFLDQLEGSIPYHIPEVLHLHGAIDTVVLGESFQQVVRRHEVLRTVFLNREGQPYQSIKDAGDWKLSLIDGRGFGGDRKVLDDYIRAIVSLPFDLSKDYMLRAMLISLGAEDHVLLLIMHHIASDGWSMSVMVKEIAELYESGISKREADLAPLPVQYADYSIWQRNYLQGEILDKKIGYWKQKLEGVASLQLPTDYQRPSVWSKRGSSKRFSIDKMLTGQLRSLSQQQGATLYMTLLAAFKILLHRYSGQQDICVGSPIANRMQQEIEGLIGFFVNTLALRSEVKSGSTFTELLQQVKSTMIEAYEHQEVPFEKVVEVVVKERELGRNPLFQVVLALQNTPQAETLRLGDIELRQEEFRSDTAKFDITVLISETSSGLECTLEYATDLYSGSTIDRMIGHYQELLSSIVSGSHQRISDLRMLTKKEEQQLLYEFNDTKTDYPRDKTIADLFEEQASRTPQSVAVVFEETELTYAELNEKANQVAHYLRSRGVKAETLVPICIERGLEMIIGIIGILKAGGAYVPIDPDYPHERIKYVLEDTRTTIALSSNKGQLKRIFTPGIEVIELDTDWATMATQPKNNPASGIRPDSLAYIIYTSGSTGKPKGVMVEHRNVVSLVTNVDYVSFTADDILLSTGSSSFDATTFEYWGMLLNGGQLILCTEIKLLDNELLKDEIERRKVTKMWFTSSWFNQLVETDLHIFATINTILVGGEKLSEQHINKLRQAYPFLKIINGYGPTENTTFSLTHDIDGIKENSSIPIGRPLTNRTAYILNEKQELLPVGITGEICVGGDGLSRGYLNHGLLTEEKFIKNPFNNENDSRLYRTGDLGRWLADGTIEFLGRVDDQVKIRGYRIELGEIERVLQRCDLVNQAVVMATENQQGDRRLIGYIIPQGEFDRSSITGYLRAQLPEYMIPSQLMELTNFPLTINGKLNRTELPSPDITKPFENEYVGPRNQMERIIAEIWKDVLQIKRAGIHDNFFHLGGHSLLAMRVISAMRKELKVETGIKDMFIHSTIASLAAYLTVTGKGNLMPAIELTPRPQELPLSFSQERLWFLDQLEGSVSYHIPEVLHLHGALDTVVLGESFHQVIRRHEVLRTVFLNGEGQPYQSIKDAGDWKLSLIDGRGFGGDRKVLDDYIRAIVSLPFDLSKDYMLRAMLISLGAEDHVLLLIMHHIASDGWSMSVMVKEIAELYESGISKREADLAPLPVQYADYSIWQRNYLQGEILDKKIGYWKQKLEGVASLQLPTDYQRPSVWSKRGSSKRFSIDKMLTGQLRSLSQQQGATLYMTLLAAFKILLHRYSGQQDICVGSPIANRMQQEIEGLIGFFVNTLALRSEVKSGSTFTELLQQVKSTMIEAYEHQEVPFEKVVEVVVKERELGRNPLFQVVLALQNTPQAETLRLGDIELRQEEFRSDTAKFDITVLISETSSGLECTLEYATDLYSGSTIDRMIGHYQELLSSIVSGSHQRISDLRMLTKKEEQQLLYEFNDTKTDYPRDKTIADLFEEQASRTPQSVAVVFEETELTYAELNEKANQVAHYLRSRGVKAETLVPICIERGLEMIIGIIGILKAGGAYVPIDPDYPHERIKYVLEDTAGTMIVSSSSSRSKLPAAIPFCEVLELDTDWHKITFETRTNPEKNTCPDNMAYILYTSGSTGKPKGVMIENRSVVNLLFSMSGSVQFTSRSSILSVTTYSFDIFYLECYMPLILGGKLIIVTRSVGVDAYKLSETISRFRPTHLQATPSTWRTLQTIGWENKEGLQILIGGEAVKEDLKEELTIKGIVWNVYGPTETTIWSTITKLEAGQKVTIGKPIANTSIYILKENHQLCPTNVIGEICIGGVGLARGYLNRPELTEEKFISNPFSQEPGSRLYRTGDLGRWLPDGNLECLGRIDDQVKIRGHRIELGEIESVLQRSELVQQAVVLARADKQGINMLVAYIIPEGTFSRDGITEYLKDQLPEYMVPSLLLEQESFPLNLNGKIDRKALPEPDITRLFESRYQAPRNEAERMLTEIWAEVLKVEQVGIHDNFFELGGHSLMILKLVNKVRKMGLQINVKDFFDYQTIDEQSNFIKTTLKLFNAANEGKFVIPIQPQGSNTPLFAFPEFLLYSEIGKYLSKEQPLYAIEHSPFKEVDEIAEHYISEIKKIYPHGPYYLAGYCNWGKIALEMAHKLIARGDQVPALIFFEYYSPSIEISRFSLKFIRNKLRFITNKMKAKLPFVEKSKFLSKEFDYALKYLNHKVLKRGSKNAAAPMMVYTGKVLLFQASETYGFKEDSHMGWKQIFQGEVKKVILQGEHLNVMTGPSAAQIAESIDSFLTKEETKEREPSYNSLILVNFPTVGLLSDILPMFN